MTTTHRAAAAKGTLWPCAACFIQIQPSNEQRVQGSDRGRTRGKGPVERKKGRRQGWSANHSTLIVEPSGRSKEMDNKQINGD